MTCEFCWKPGSDAVTIRGWFPVHVACAQRLGVLVWVKELERDAAPVGEGAGYRPDDPAGPFMGGGAQVKRQAPRPLRGLPTSAQLAYEPLPLEETRGMPTWLAFVCAALAVGGFLSLVWMVVAYA